MQERDILISPLDRSHTGDGYPYISTGHVSCRCWISYFLCWTGLILIKDIHQQTCIILRIWISPVESGTLLYTGDMQHPVHCYILQYPTELCDSGKGGLAKWQPSCESLKPSTAPHSKLRKRSEREHSTPISHCSSSMSIHSGQLRSGGSIPCLQGE